MIYCLEKDMSMKDIYLSVLKAHIKCDLYILCNEDFEKGPSLEN